MQRLRTVSLGLALLAGSAGLTQAQNGGGINYRELFQQLDANGDRVVDRGEVPESGQAAFDQLVKHADGNKDGRIDLEEYQQMLVSLREAFSAPGARFAALDKNGDGKIARDEFPGPPFLFTRADANGDGVLTKDEAEKLPSGPGPGGPAAAAAFRQRVLAMDKNGDGKVSKDEFTGQPGVFDRLDANKDGFVTPQEAAQPARPGAGGPPPARPGLMGPGLRAMDKNNDGKISKDEFTGPAPLFDRLDRNSDGFISTDELPGGRPGAAGARGARRRPAAEKV
jgi:Ca2+-binding EF-hand superfamily protein